MFELLYKLLKKLFGRKDDPEKTIPKVKSQTKKRKSPQNNSKENSESKNKKPKRKKKKKKEEEEGKEEELEEEIYFPIGISGKKRKKQNKEKKKKEKKLKKEKYGPLTAIVLIVALSIHIIPSTIAMILGKEVSINATISKSQTDSNTYDITYEFEQDLNNLYSDIKAGDKMPLSKLLWGTDIDTEITITYINREKGFFKTSLPHTISSWELVYKRFVKFGKPRNAIITLKVTGLSQKITDITRR